MRTVSKLSCYMSNVIYIPLIDDKKEESTNKSFDFEIFLKVKFDFAPLETRYFFVNRF